MTYLDTLTKLENYVRMVKAPAPHHTTIQDSYIFDILQEVPALCTKLRKAVEALEWIEMDTRDQSTPGLSKRSNERACAALKEIGYGD